MLNLIPLQQVHTTQAAAQPFVTGKLYLHASLQILYLSDLYLAHLLNTSEIYNSLTSRAAFWYVKVTTPFNRVTREG